jgi:hypothetical protein
MNKELNLQDKYSLLVPWLQVEKCTSVTQLPPFQSPQKGEIC